MLILFRRAPLRAMLHDAFILASGSDGDRAFMQIVAARFLDIHILAGLARPDRHQRMPVIRRGNGNRVHILAFEHLPDVLHDLRFGALQVAQLFLPLGKRPRVGIDQVGNRYARHRGEFLDVIAAPAVEAADRQTNGVVRTHDAPG
jgi:hypothetical protein